MPDDIIVGHFSPAATDLGGLAQRRGIEVAEDLEAELWRQSRHEVDFDQVADRGGDEGELREAALGEDALQHEVAMLGRGSGEEGPDVGNGLLVGL